MNKKIMIIGLSCVFLLCFINDYKEEKLNKEQIEFQIEQEDHPYLQDILEVQNKIKYLKGNIDEDFNRELSESIVKYCNEFNIPYNIAISIAFRQSSFRQLAISYADCVGVFQVNPKAHPWIDKNRMYQIDYNVFCGLTILRQYKNIVDKRYPEKTQIYRWQKALVRYNGLVPNNPYGKWVLQIHSKLQKI